MARISFLNFHQLSIHPGDLLSTSVNNPCYQKTFHHLSVWLGNFLSTFVNFLFSRETIRKLPSTFRATGTPSTSFHQLSVPPGKTFVKICQHSMWPGDLPSTSVNILHARETYPQLLLTFQVAGRPSVNFPCVRKTF